MIKTSMQKIEDDETTYTKSKMPPKNMAKKIS